jgi:glutamine synthetase
MANNAGTILSRLKEEEIDWVDLRFTDPKGKWQGTISTRRSHCRVFRRLTMLLF